MTVFRPPLVLLPYVLGLVGVTGAVHLATILAFPAHATQHDAFARVAALTKPGVLTAVRSQHDLATLPVTDGAMDLSLCRFDLRDGPLRITVDPFDDGFLSIGMHARSGAAFYGLNLTSSDRDAIAMVLMTAADVAKAEEADSDDEPQGDLRITVPEPEGFVTIQSPEVDPVVEAATLAHVHCVPERRADGLPQP